MIVVLQFDMTPIIEDHQFWPKSYLNEILGNWLYIWRCNFGIKFGEFSQVYGQSSQQLGACILACV